MTLQQKNISYNRDVGCMPVRGVKCSKMVEEKAKSMGYQEGVYVDIGVGKAYKLHGNKMNYDPVHDCIMYDDIMIYECGKWASIVNIYKVDIEFMDGTSTRESTFGGTAEEAILKVAMGKPYKTVTCKI